MKKFFGKLRAFLNKQKIRFILVGGFNTAFGYALFALVSTLFSKQVGYIGALLMAHAVSSSLAYSLHSRLVFNDGHRGPRVFLKFQSVYVVPLLTNLLALPVLVEFLKAPVLLAQAAFSLSWVALSFLAHRDFTFRPPVKKQQE